MKFNVSEILKDALIRQQAAQQSLGAMPDILTKVVLQFIHTFTTNGKIIACGNGGSAGDAMHLASELINRYQLNRKSLPALAITTDSQVTTAIANDSSYTEVFSRQLEGLLMPQDTLILFTTSGNSKNLLSALATAQSRNATCIAFTGKDGGTLANHLRKRDIEVRIGSDETARIQEMHLTCIHVICESIENWLSETS